MGAVFEPNGPYCFRSDLGAILLIVETTELAAHGAKSQISRLGVHKFPNRERTPRMTQSDRPKPFEVEAFRHRTGPVATPAMGVRARRVSPA